MAKKGAKTRSQSFEVGWVSHIVSFDSDLG